MSASAMPIPPERFAEAVLDLPLANLHFKAAEIRNSVSHLESSNAQLQPFADEGDRDCTDAIRENEETMMRMEERILMLRQEVERRGFQWGEDVNLSSADPRGSINGNKGGEIETEETRHVSQPTDGGAAAEPQRRSANGTRGNEDLVRTLRENTHIDEDEDAEGTGIHL